MEGEGILHMLSPDFQLEVVEEIYKRPCRIHIRDHRFCLTSGSPPRLLGAWALMDLRRYGVVDGRFVWEGGTRSLRGCGVHVAISDTPNEISRSLDLASRGALNSKHRRGSIPQPSAGTIQRDAAMWLRDVGAIDICQFSEIGDTLSIVASEAGSILSPRTEFVAERRPDCDIVGNSYTTAGSSSSSGSIVGDEPGWWANTWASGRGSLWEVAPSPIPEKFI
ncbi:Protein Dok-7 [Armadillidium vulgare]|nr:Protein Dok-7 [Armadillidium vulgare]